MKESQIYEVIIYRFNEIIHKANYQLNFDSVDYYVKGIYKGLEAAGLNPTGYEYLNNPEINFFNKQK
jgi:hypothetical protein